MTDIGQTFESGNNADPSFGTEAAVFGSEQDDVFDFSSDQDYSEHEADLDKYFPEFGNEAPNEGEDLLGWEGLQDREDRLAEAVGKTSLFGQVSVVLEKVKGIFSKASTHEEDSGESGPSLVELDQFSTRALASYIDTKHGDVEGFKNAGDSNKAPEIFWANGEPLQEVSSETVADVEQTNSIKFQEQTTEQTEEQTTEFVIEEYESPAEALEQQGYVKRAPKFEDQVEEEGRDNEFTYYESLESLFNATGENPIEMTEGEGLRGLQEFARSALETIAQSSNGKQRREEIYLEDLLENLTFIGEREYQEAVAGIAELWKQYLDEDPDRQICALLDAIEKTSGDDGKRKSDSYMFEQILNNFSEEELELYGERIVSSVSDLTAEPENSRVVLLDDWIISGHQMRTAFGYLSATPEFQKYIPSLEINLIATSEARAANGLKVNNYEDDDTHIPIRGYYVAHKSTQAAHEHESIVSGTHSSVDYDFEVSIATAVQLVNMLTKDGESEVTMPPLTNIKRPYRYAPRVYEQIETGSGGRRFARRTEASV